MVELYREALTHLKKGDTLLYPSDTIWGLGCDARNEKAVEKILSIKHRPANKAFIVLISKIEQLSAELHRHNFLYYQQSSPEISDRAFDLLLEELIQLEKQYPENVCG